MPDTIIDLPLPNEPHQTLVIRLRHRPDGKSTFQARRILPMEQRRNSRNPYKTKSLRTNTVEEAKALAYKWERAMHGKIERKEPLDDISFRRCSESYLAWAVERSKHVDRLGNPLINLNGIRREETCIRRYLIPYFGDRDLRQITQVDVERYVEWRTDYYVDGPGFDETTIDFRRGGKVYSRPAARNVRPSRSTLNKDVVAYNKVLKHARRKHGLSLSMIPRIIFQKNRLEPTNRRPRFDDDEWDLLENTAAAAHSG